MEAYNENNKQLIEFKEKIRLYEILANAIPDVIYIIDPDSNIIEVNKRAEDYGYKTAELIGRPFSDLVTDEYKEVARQMVIERRAKIMEIKNGIRKQFSSIVELPFITKSNETAEMRVSGNTFVADFEVQTIRVHKGEPIKKNHIYTVGIARDISEQKKFEREKEQLIAELEKSLNNVKTLSGLLPICANCKKVRDDKGYWSKIESYIEQHSEAKFSHGMCEECAEELYGDTTWYKNRKNGEEL